MAINLPAIDLLERSVLGLGVCTGLALEPACPQLFDQIDGRTDRFVGLPVGNPTGQVDQGRCTGSLIAQRGADERKQIGRLAPQGLPVDKRGIDGPSHRQGHLRNPDLLDRLSPSEHLQRDRDAQSQIDLSIDQADGARRRELESLIDFRKANLHASMLDSTIGQLDLDDRSIDKH